MSLQTIIDAAETISIGRLRSTAQSISRSGRVLTSDLAGAQPQTFSITMHGGMKYSTNRAVLQAIDTLDVVSEAQINIGQTNSRLSWVTQYLGGANLSAATIVSASGNTLRLNTTGTTGSGFLFKAGDWLKPTGAYRYPYQVTADVPYTASASVAIPVHRPVISQTAYTLIGAGIVVGSAVTWRVKMRTKPQWTIVPTDRVEWSGTFDLIEIIE